SFFFSSRRRHTRSYGDWSSDVCSSYLGLCGRPLQRRITLRADGRFPQSDQTLEGVFESGWLQFLGQHRTTATRKAAEDHSRFQEIGRASCRERTELREGSGVGEENSRA